MSRVRAADRLRDAAAATFLIVGAALYLYAGAQMRGMAAGELTPPPGSTHIQETDRRMGPLTTVSRVGLGLVVVGIGIGIWSFLRHRSSTSSQA